MELGEKLRQARLEAGLSQRQLCGDIITRNMLSQIENGSAKPSFATLEALCARLGKPMSLFSEATPSQNAQLLHNARQQPPEQALKTLEGYLSPDPMLEDVYRQLKCRLLLTLAQQALSDGRTGYARSLLTQAQPLLQPEDQREYTLLLYRAAVQRAPELVAQLPDNTYEQLLRAEAALQSGDPKKCIAHLQCADARPDHWHLLFADAMMLQGDYAAAAQSLQEFADRRDSRFFSRLEICYRELKDFEKAYYYACLQRT